MRFEIPFLENVDTRIRKCQMRRRVCRPHCGLTPLRGAPGIPILDIWAGFRDSLSRNKMVKQRWAAIPKLALKLPPSLVDIFSR